MSAVIKNWSVTNSHLTTLNQLDKEDQYIILIQSYGRKKFNIMQFDIEIVINRIEHLF